jgi:antitoxin MazE
MNVQVKKWGNSAAVRIPAATLAAARLQIDDRVEVREEDGRIVIEAAREPSLQLDDLLAKVTDANLHRETDFGPPAGNEAW